MVRKNKQDAAERRLKLITNISRMGKVTHPDINIIHAEYSPGKSGILSTFLHVWKYRRYDYFIFNGSGYGLFLLSVFKLFVPNQNIKIVSLDLLLPQPSSSYADKIKTFIRRVLLFNVHLFLHYYKKTEGIQYYYKIPSDKFRYVPFKINQYEKVLNAKTGDRGYVFCGGKTRRDFDTLIKAVWGLDIPVKIVTMDNQYIREHGSHLDDHNLPDNVEVIRLDGSFDPFLDYMAQARLVVLPLKPHICGTGIGVYIMAMALKKCLIISNNVSVEGLLDDEKAIIVPPNDSVSLRNALLKAYNDENYRMKYAYNGYQYAITLGGEEKLNKSIINVIIDDWRLNL